MRRPAARSRADDYWPKPFLMEAPVARARSVIRRAAGHAASAIEAGLLSLDLGQMLVNVNGVPATLLRLGNRLVAHLSHAPRGSRREALGRRATRLFVIRRGRVIAQAPPAVNRLTLNDSTYHVDFRRPDS